MTSYFGHESAFVGAFTQTVSQTLGNGISASDVSITDVKGVTAASHVDRDAVSTLYEDGEDSSTAVSYSVDISDVDGFSDPSDAYSSLSSTLVDAVNDGSFTSTLQSVGSSSGAYELDSATSSQVTVLPYGDTTSSPTLDPTLNPTYTPTLLPTLAPSDQLLPTLAPSEEPLPTLSPSEEDASDVPTFSPSQLVTLAPTEEGTYFPTISFRPTPTPTTTSPADYGVFGGFIVVAGIIILLVLWWSIRSCLIYIRASRKPDTGRAPEVKRVKVAKATTAPKGGEAAGEEETEPLVRKKKGGSAAVDV